MTEKDDYATLSIVPAAPSALHEPEGDEEVFQRLKGAKIVNIGSPSSAEIEGGGLVIDYQLPRSSKTHRVVFAFTEEGMWCVFDDLSD